ncbi:protein translocase subunit SecF [Alicyclobacillus sp. ALC3]|uniref:protein translocase subunit SecF n=1 Tax=Alicyclobacillus sp. ALC3 TaxID=2796143 RepID=UPI0023790EE8|nr:protein translocase subunit SecF [Alicyclobacillus sp. ALC3]WDL96189.1 protein translocase subunit SecF [Alicyclobacillus sp. ALC3]
MKVHFSLIKRSKWFFLLSGLITVTGLVVFLISGFNLGTDFVSGSRIQLQINQTVNNAEVRDLFNKAGITIEQQAITSAGTGAREAAIVRLTTRLTPAQQNKILSLEKQMYPKSSSASFSVVDPIVAKQTSRQAIWAILLASAFIIAYIAIRFEYRFAIAGVVAVLHDAFIVLATFSLLRLQVDLPFVAAVLTIVGYSINDTIVIFDRIRENMKATPPNSREELQELVDKSLWQTMSRSINTVVAVLVAAVMLYFFGGTALHNFTFALIVGLVSGAYSSIFIASPLWVAWRSRQFRTAAPVKTS